MTKTWDFVTITAALGCGAVGGIFLAFSSFVMAGLARLPDAQGIAAMKSINITAVRPVFMLALFGSAALCVGLVVRAVTTWGSRAAALQLAGGLVYLVGCIGVTIAYNVPRNDRLARLSAPTAEQWHTYVGEWTAANHIRTVAGLAAMLLLVLAALARQP